MPSLSEQLLVFCETECPWSSCSVELTFSIVWTKQFNQGCVALKADLLPLSPHAVDAVISRNELQPSVHNKWNYLYGSVSCLLWQVKVIVANETLSLGTELTLYHCEAGPDLSHVQGCIPP